MTRFLITHLAIALFALQNFVFCCGHVHANDGEESSSCQPHVHFHEHDGHHHHHGDDHGHHHHHHSEPDENQQNEQPNSHDCSITALKQLAIVPNTEIWPAAVEASDQSPIFVQLPNFSPVNPMVKQLANHFYWHQSCSISLQVCALII